MDSQLVTPVLVSRVKLLVFSVYEKKSADFKSHLHT